MAINTALNRDPFATGGVMDAPDKAVTIAMNKIALGMQLTPQELGRLATRQKLEQQSNAVAAQKASFQSLIGQAPIDVRSYKGSMWAGANPQEDQANAALEARFGKRVPGQIDISYGGQQPAATPQYTPAYAPATGLLGQAQEAQYDTRAAQRPSALATGLGEFGAGATTPLTSAFNPSVFSALPTQAPAYSPAMRAIDKTPMLGATSPQVPASASSAMTQGTNPAVAAMGQPSAINALAGQKEQEPYGGLMGALEAIKGVPTPSSNRAGEIARNIAMLPATISNYIVGGSRRMREGMAEREDILSGSRAARSQAQEDQQKQIANIDKEIQDLTPSAGQASVSNRIDYLRNLRGRMLEPISENLIKLPGDIGGVSNLQRGYKLGSGPLAIDSASSAGIIPPPLSEAVSAEGVPFTPAEKAQMQASEQAQMRAQQTNAPIQQAGAVQAPQVAAPQAPQAITPEAAPQQQQMAADAQDFSGFTQDTRPTRIYAFGNNASVEPSPIQQAKGERVKPLFETSVDAAIASSPSGRAASAAEARFLNTLNQQEKEALKTRQDEYRKNVANALALNPSLNINNLPKLDQNAARVMAAEIKKKTGLDEKQNSDAFSAAIKEAGNIPVGDEKISTIMSSFVRNGGGVTPEFVKQVQDLYKAPVDVTKAQGYTIVRAGDTYRVFDQKMNPFDVNRAEKDQFVDLLTDSVLKYPSWESLPNEEKKAFVKLNIKHPQPVDAATGKIPSARQIWNQHQEDFSTSPAPVATSLPATVKPTGARPAAKPSVPAAKPPPGFSVSP